MDDYIKPVEDLNKNVLEDLKSVFGTSDGFEVVENAPVYPLQQITKIEILVLHGGNPCFPVVVSANIEDDAMTTIVRAQMNVSSSMYGILTNHWKYILFSACDKEKVCEGTITEIKEYFEKKESFEKEPDEEFRTVDFADVGLAALSLAFPVAISGYAAYKMLKGERSPIEKKVKNIIREFKSPESKKQSENDPIEEKVQDIIEKIISYESNDNVDFNVLIHRMKAAFNVFKESKRDFDYITKTVSFSRSEDEDSFFLALLGGEIKGEICRYTSLTSLFLTLKNSKHNMCSIQCMNDKSEGIYADEILFSNGRLRLSGEKDIESKNKAFILSCCKNENTDNLLLWKFYGDDAKGVCLKYEQMEHADALSNCFYIAPVSYAYKKGFHPELIFIKGVKAAGVGKKWNFNFRRWDIWKYFFKPHSYINEKEVRVLYLTTADESQKDNITTEWIIDNRSGIICEMKQFNYEYSESKNYFPLKITKVILGPKTSEVDVNRQQLGYLLSKSKVYKTDNPYTMIEKSGIEYYR